MTTNRDLRMFAMAVSLAAAALAGCTTAGPVSSGAHETSSAASASMRTLVPSPTPPPNLPAELVGSWETDLRDFLDDDEICSPCGPEVRFIVREDGTWTIARAGGQASGRFTVEDGQIVFGPSTACEGIGSYEWQTDGGTLTLKAVGNDECERRQEALDGPTYSRED